MYKINRLKKLNYVNKQSFFFENKSLSELEQQFYDITSEFEHLVQKEKYDKEYNFIDSFKKSMLSKKLSDLAYKMELIENGYDQ